MTGAAQRGSSDDGEEREPDAAFGAAADDEADAAGYRERGQGLFLDIFADVAIAPTAPIDVVREGGSG